MHRLFHAASDAGLAAPGDVNRGQIVSVVNLRAMDTYDFTAAWEKGGKDLQDTSRGGRDRTYQDQGESMPGESVSGSLAYEPILVVT